MGYPAYSEYQQSNHKWLGEIPSHWESTPLKRKYRLVNGSTPKSSEPLFWDGNIVWVTPADFDDISDGYIRTSSRMITDDGLSSCGTTVVPENSVVVTTRAPIGKIAQAGRELCTNQGCKSLVRDSNELLERFVFYTLVAGDVQLNALGLGTTFMELSKDDLGYYTVALPSPTEQQKIVDFLDWKTGQIDGLIAKKKQLIEKLNEKRIALITQAVTKGINPDAPMRDSGIPWLGEVPAHWDVAQLRRIITLQRGVDITKEEQEEGEVPVVSSGGISSYHSTALMKGPGVLVGRKGTAGAVHYIDSDYWPHDTTLYVKEFWGNHPRFVYYLLSSMHLTRFDTGSSNPTVNRNLVHPEKVAWPTFDEQSVIANSLDASTNKIVRIVETLIGAIGSLIEYRTALITAATTGKIDVRNVKIGGGA